MSAPSTVEPSNSRSLLVGERDVLEHIATDAPLEATLDLVCRVIDDQSGIRSSIFLLDNTGKRLSFAAGPHIPASWRTVVAAFPITETACGAAIRDREQVIVPEIDADPRFAGYHDAARAAGIRAAWSTPILSNAHVPLGTFAMHSGIVGCPTEENLALVRRATHLARLAIERRQSETALRESEIRFSRVFYGNPAPMAISTLPDDRIADVNDSFLQMFGYSRDEIVGRPTSILYLDPRQRQAKIGWLSQGSVRAIEFQGRTKAGERLDLLCSMERIEVVGQQCVLSTAMDLADRTRAENALRASEQQIRQQEHLLRLVLDAIPVGVLVVDLSGDIILSNPPTERIWSRTIRSGQERWEKGRAWWHQTGRLVQPNEWASRRALTRGETSINELLDIEAFDGSRKTIQNSAVPILDDHGAIAGAVIAIEDVTARTTAERNLHRSEREMRALAGKLMHAQDDERRRIAALLHETAAQDLAALKMLLARLARTSEHLSDAERAVLNETGELADHVMNEVRTLSYLLHPPFLDETGLLSAIRWYAEGFADRSGIAVHLDLPPMLPRHAREVETTMFRVVQESLINIHRHANSPTADIRVRLEPDNLALEIEDHGQGITAEVLGRLRGDAGTLGVGIAGMRERLRQLGGSLDIETTLRGTLVRALVPLAPGSSDTGPATRAEAP